MGEDCARDYYFDVGLSQCVQCSFLCHPKEIQRETMETCLSLCKDYIQNYQTTMRSIKSEYQNDPVSMTVLVALCCALTLIVIVLIISRLAGFNFGKLSNKGDSHNKQRILTSLSSLPQDTALNITPEKNSGTSTDSPEIYSGNDKSEKGDNETTSLLPPERNISFAIQEQNNDLPERGNSQGSSAQDRSIQLEAAHESDSCEATGGNLHEYQENGPSSNRMLPLQGANERSSHDNKENGQLEMVVAVGGRLPEDASEPSLSGAGFRPLQIPEENDGFLPAGVELMQRSLTDDSDIGSIFNPEYDNRAGFHIFHVDNNALYEQLQVLPWVMGYHSEGRSISVYANLNQYDRDDLHRQLIETTRQPRGKFKIRHINQARV